MNRLIGLGLTSGLLGGLVSFAFARLRVTPLIDTAIGYEEQRSHAEAELTGAHVHTHELFTRTVQENVGAGVGVIVFGMVVGALFAVAFASVSAFLARRGIAADGRWSATALAAAAFVALCVVPFAVYPANPPGTGQEQTMADRTTAYLAILLLSAGLAVAALVIGARMTPRLGGWAAGVLAALGYLATVGAVAALLPAFDEIPGPLTGVQGEIVFPGFPAALLFDFRMNALMTTGVLWLVTGAAFAALLPRVLGAGRSSALIPEELHAHR